MHATRMSARRLLGPVLLIATSGALPGAAGAQVVVPGATRVQMSDVTGPNVGSLLLFETGTTKTFTCPVAWGVRTTAESLTAALRAGTLEITTATGVARTPSGESQRRVLALLEGGADAAAAGAAVEAALAAQPADGEVAEEARELVHELDGLFAVAAEMDPSDPGYRTATGLADAIHQFNDYVDDASVTTPSDEFLVIETVLSRLVLSALENEGRDVDAASRDGANGLACAPPAVVSPPPAAPEPEPPTEPEPPPVVERPITVCVLTNGRIQYVPAILLPATSDTLAIRDSERVRFDVAYPEAGYAGHLPWVYAGESITIGRDHFAPFGEAFAVKPTDELVPAGEYRGVTFFRRDDAPTPPDVVLLPTTPRCMVQPYRLQEDVRKSGG
jgi:hypothetical protein